MVYSREAHAADSNRPAGKDIEQPVTTEERREVAVKFLDDMGLEMPALLDNIDDKTSKDYASLPDRMYLVGKDGKIAYAGDRGPRGFKPDELADAIDQELGGAKPKSKSTEAARPQGGSGQMDERRARRIMQMPAVAAVNTDGDDKISAEEIEAASESLKSLDKDGDGEISAEEMNPGGRGGRGGRGGGRGGRGR